MSRDEAAASAARNAPRRRTEAHSGISTGTRSSARGSTSFAGPSASAGGPSTDGPSMPSRTGPASSFSRGSRASRPAGRQRGASSSSSSSGGGSYLLQAAALQDHFARNLRMQGAGKKVASLQPGSELTLAQRYGLVRRPPALLTTSEWKDVHERSRAREDSLGECVICREDFKNEDQILLSCSHVFHKQCIDAFERFAKQRCCPLCRTEQYQKKRIEDGRKLYRNKCATKIQACYKGHLVRKAYKKLRRHVPYKDPRLKRRWLEDRIEEQSSALVREVEQDRGDLDSFFAELDASVAKSKADMEEAEAALLRRREPPRFGRRSGRHPDQLLLALNPAASWNPYSDEPRELDGGAATPSAEGSSLAQQHISGPAGPQGSVRPGKEPVIQDGDSSIDWASVISKASDREFADCPICLGPLHRNGQKGIAYFSCTHCFHVDCIACFEAFEAARGNDMRCPVCRSAYEKKVVYSNK